MIPHPVHHEQPPHSSAWLGLAGFFGGGMSSLLGIGGGLIAVPVLLYVGRMPVQAVAPTALAGVCLTTLAGSIGYMTGGAGPPVSPWMVGFVDARMALPLAIGAVTGVPLGVRLQPHPESSETLLVLCRDILCHGRPADQGGVGWLDRELQSLVRDEWGRALGLALQRRGYSAALFARSERPAGGLAAAADRGYRRRDRRRRGGDHRDAGRRGHRGGASIDGGRSGHAGTGGAPHLRACWIIDCPGAAQRDQSRVGFDASAADSRRSGHRGRAPAGCLCHDRRRRTGAAAGRTPGAEPEDDPDQDRGVGQAPLPCGGSLVANYTTVLGVDRGTGGARGGRCHPRSRERSICRCSRAPWTTSRNSVPWRRSPDRSGVGDLATVRAHLEALQGEDRRSMPS